jgi:hypothetical protein
MVLPALGALDVVLVAAAPSEPEMVLRPLRLDDVLTVAAAAPTVPVSAAAAPPVPVTSAAGAVGVAPLPLRLGNVVVGTSAKTPLLGSLVAFLFPVLVGMVMRINAELLMFLAQKTE